VLLKKAKNIQFIASCIPLAGIAVLSLVVLMLGASVTTFNIFAFYPFSLFCLMLFCVGMLLVNALSYRYSDNYTNMTLPFSFTFGGMFMIATSVSMLVVLFGFELVMLSTTCLIMLGGRRSAGAAIKLLIMGSVSIILFTFALALIFPYDVGLSVIQIAQNSNMAGDYLIVLAMVLFTAALAFGVSLFPFNLLVPDVYHDAPTTITAVIAGVTTIASFSGLIIIFFTVFAAYQPVFSAMFAILSIATMLFGSILALVQTDMKRLLACSTISQAGCIMIGLAIVVWLESFGLKSINDYFGLRYRNRYAAPILTILMLSMIGVPPLLGFYGKFLLFSSAIGAGLPILAVFGVISSVMLIYCYAKVINAMYAQKQHGSIKTDAFAIGVALIAVMVIVVFGLYQQPLIATTTMASSSFAYNPLISSILAGKIS
jgi:NADH-quinone oxidoreductase subunit N